MLLIRHWFNRLEEKTKISDDLVDWLKTSTSSVDQKLTRNLEVFARLQKTIGEFSEIGRSMQELQEFLSSPKLRGNIGEQVLRDLLAQYFPKSSYVLQYGFKNGEKVDAVIKTAQGLIPIDSKFPIENFRKMIKEPNEVAQEKHRKLFFDDVKKHINDIARKYILVEQGTVDYALMYIPSESVYYEIINNNSLFDFSGERRVLPVSPMSFYAYMKAILMSFEGEKIETKAKEILNVLRAIKKDYEKTDEALAVMMKHISNAYNQGAQVAKNFDNLGQKLSSTELISSKEERKLIE